MRRASFGSSAGAAVSRDYTVGPGVPTYRLGLEDKIADIKSGQRNRPITLFLCGDVMTGRGIDQILPHSGDPTLHEPHVRDAREYVELAVRKNGQVGREVDFNYIWGDAIEELDRLSPHVRIINLETAVTTSDDWWQGKQVHYRMHPRNIPCITAANVDCAVLANNHVLDWGYDGLEETLITLEAAGVTAAGAGRNRHDAQRPAVFELPGARRLLVFGVGSPTSGVPERWEATDDQPGIHITDETLVDRATEMQQLISRFRRRGDIVLVSIHWGSNWGYDIPRPQRRFAHDLIDDAGVDIVHGHSSHHVRAVEVYRNRPILYGCGDLLTDYEGISGHERFRGDLSLMYFVSINADTGELATLEMRPTQVRKMQLRRPSRRDVTWLVAVLSREWEQFSTRVERADDDLLTLRWD